MKKLWLILVGLLLLTACSDDVPDPNPEKPDPEKPQVFKGRTILAYLISNNGPSSFDLDNYLKTNVIDMYKGLSTSTKSEALLVFYRPKKSDADLLGVPSILKFVADGKGHINGRKPIPASELEVAPDCSNGSILARKVFAEAEIIPCASADDYATDPRVMEQALRKMVELVPSERYGLTMGSHATGWIYANMIDTRAFGDDNKYHINIPELGEVLTSVFGEKKLDYILFDACMMASAEVAYELRKATDHVIASVYETSVYGHPYAEMLPSLYAEQVDYQRICGQFADFNKSKGLWGALSVVDCNKIEQLAEWIRKELPSYADQLTTSFANTVVDYGIGGFDKYSYDVLDVFRQLKIDNLLEIKELVEEVVVAKSLLTKDEIDSSLYHFTTDPARYSGVGMYLPYISGDSKWDAYYISNLGWSKAIGWENFKQ